ncbi:hypothetical protein VF14_27800 [Nostoc linckia z18]|uniref:Uncharacterized protein n=2 Tax=Nostoc linckia TaxID=92942 RepID=A0A9Q5ZBU1_NOSLI|nr:hypothetical protein [Nostoc linckia]PHK39411.1 hypothetical protein VF12_14510 [Nostoc linckia z15]PHK43436.1 hypothetical protein VF13_27085 [Nostoc linckia z16]PHJ66969.1 hypothetical protein VF02_06545 [Nostoc linckia z1]PHJ67699.1 hypothetical protein VF05_16870 [Nostoc linckia z3]PHJ77231.1 hypothetical protein VF03_05105 [Nostoc linckia z2]
MNINDIIGKAWLLNLDNSEGYVLSFKLVEHNNSSPMSPETEQEEKNTLIGKNLLNNPILENSEKTLNQPNNLVSTKKSTFISSSEVRDLRAEFREYFFGNDTNLQSFVEEINRNKQATDILQIKYEEIGTTVQEKIRVLIDRFAELDALKLLKEIYENWK